MNRTTKEKYEALLQQIRPLHSAIVAFSGGIDSTLVAYAARQALGKERALAITARSPSVPGADLAAVARIAAEIDIPHEFLSTAELDDPNYAANPSNRCYFCKSELYGKLTPIAAGRGYAAVLNGTNVDDHGDYRPGLQAAAEKNVRAPLADAGLTKSDIREISRAVGLSVAEKPASPCLASRIPYGEPVTIAKLRMIDAAETVLREFGFPECRVRHHEKLARIEVPHDQIQDLLDGRVRDAIDAKFREIGYAHVTVDLRGFRSGSMNEVLLGAGFERGAGKSEQSISANKAGVQAV